MSFTTGLSAATEIDYLFSSTGSSISQFDSLANSALSRGIDRYSKKDYAGAAREFQRSLGLSPSSENAPQAYDYLAKAYLKLVKTDEAIKTYKKAIRAYPTDDSFSLGLGDLYFKLGKYDEAITNYNQAVRLNPRSADNRYSLGLAYLTAGRLAEAEDQFNQVAQLAPDSPVGFFGRGQVFRASGKYDQALAELNKAIKMDGKFANAFQELGYTYTDLKDLDQAQKQVDVLDRLGATSQSVMLQGYMNQTAEPRLVLVYSPDSFPSYLGPKTEVSLVDSSLSSPGAGKNFTLSFSFSKDMDITSVETLTNWQIGRQTGDYLYENYNFGGSIPASEVTLPKWPIRAVYNPESRTALVTFRLSQNEDGDGTIDPSHILFKFTGQDIYGKAMDPGADAYSGFSLIV
jgi:Tfp pilus assembly protein PilF